MSAHPSPQIIFFDAAGTLLHLPLSVGHHYREVALRHGLDLPAAALERAFRRAFHQLPPPPTTRAPRPDDDRGWWQTLVDQVFDACGTPASFDRPACFHELYHEFTRPGVWALFPEVRPVLAALAPHYRLGLISNFDGRLRTILRHENLAHLFEVWAVSSEVGADKPDPWIYQIALEQAQVPASAALHIGDDPELDWQAAAAAGLQTFPLDRPRNTLTDLLPLLNL